RAAPAPPSPSPAWSPTCSRSGPTLARATPARSSIGSTSWPRRARAPPVARVPTPCSARTAAPDRARAIASFAIAPADRTWLSFPSTGHGARVGAMSKAVDRAPEAGDPDADADVARLIAAGDTAAAIRLLMQRHGDAVYRFLRNALRDDAHA